MDVSGYKISVEKLFNEWHKEKGDLKNEIDNFKKVNDEKVKEIEKLKSENR